MKPVLVFMMIMSGCACWNDPAKMHDEKCVVARQIVDCSSQDLSSLLPVGKPVLDYFLGGMAGPFDWGAVLRALSWVGFDKAICILEQLQKTYSAPGLRSPPPLDVYLREKYPRLVVRH